MKNYLKKPYPFNDDKPLKIKVIILIGIGIFGILALFQPFGLVDYHTTDKIYIYFGVALVTLIILTLNLLILPSYFPKLFLREKWNIRKEIFWNIWILTSISLGYYFYSLITGFFNIDILFILKALLISVIPVSVLVNINQERLLRLNLKEANKLNKKLLEGMNGNYSREPQFFTFPTDNLNEHFELDLNLLLFIRSANNYVEIFWESKENAKKNLIRHTLSKTKDSLTAYGFIFRCHRTALVNINSIKEITGNSQGYRLSFENTNEEVPVSRNYVKKLKALLK